ncbi:hypothetical protein ACHAWF_013264 [Thalassiosira exigua]
MKPLAISLTVVVAMGLLFPRSGAVDASSLRGKQRIMILMLGDQHLFAKQGNKTGVYYSNWKSMERYASKHDYHALQVDRSFAPECANVTERYWYSKQCTVAKLLDKYDAEDSYDWIAVVDGDTAVVNDERRIEEFIPEGNVADCSRSYLLHPQPFRGYGR